MPDDRPPPHGKLLRFGDIQGGQCWSQVKSPKGETIWISIAHTGILVKISKWGLFGKKLFEETNPVLAGRVAQTVNVNVDGLPAPRGMNNIVLTSLTMNAIMSSSAAEFAEKLEQARGAINIPSPRAQAEELAEATIISGYRTIWAKTQVGAGPNVTEFMILSIYDHVQKGFGKAAEERGEKISVEKRNVIALHILEVYRERGAKAADDQIASELETYKARGA